MKNTSKFELYTIGSEIKEREEGQKIMVKCDSLSSLNPANKIRLMKIDRKFMKDFLAMLGLASQLTLYSDN